MGVRQWLFQRACNLIFVLFGAWLLIALLSGSLNSFESANSLLSGGMNKVILAVVLLLAAANSVLAGWQIAGDYAHKINVSENILVGIAILVSVAYVIFGITILM